MTSSSVRLFIIVSLSLGLTGFSACTTSAPRSPNSQTSNSSMSAAESSQNSSEDDLDQPSACPTGQFSKRTGFSLCFNNSRKQAIWVSYSLTREQLENPVTDRSDDFVTDPEFNSAGPTDFYGTIYERGHLAPSADMKWSHQAQADSFSMANMTPQTHMMNHGRWKDLEEQVRNWARKFGRIFIVMGPMPEATSTNVPGTSVPIPKAHFKCVLFAGSETGSSLGPAKSICFIIPQEPTQTLASYIHTVDDVEVTTHLDLFSRLDDAIETRIESEAVLDNWMRGLSMKPFMNSSRPKRNAPTLKDRIDLGTGVSRPKKSASESSGAFSCAPKTCKQIRTCAEAKYLLNTCGQKRLDVDGDGTPCEALCK